MDDLDHLVELEKLLAQALPHMKAVRAYARLHGTLNDRHDFVVLEIQIEKALAIVKKHIGRRVEPQD